MITIPWDRQNEKQRAKTVADIKRRGVHASKHPAWPLLLRVAGESRWPRAFAADLYVHDRGSLEGAEPSTPFLWAIGETGTQIYWLASPTGKPRTHTESEAIEHVAYLECYRPRMYHWDGATLRTCTRLDAIGVLRGFAWGDPEGW
jgi:hypothetical protein